MQNWTDGPLRRASGNYATMQPCHPYLQVTNVIVRSSIHRVLNQNETCNGSRPKKIRVFLLPGVWSQSATTSTHSWRGTGNHLVASREGIGGIALIVKVCCTPRWGEATVVGRTHEASLHVSQGVHWILTTQDTSREGPFQRCQGIGVAHWTRSFRDVSCEAGATWNFTAVPSEDVLTFRKIHRAGHIFWDAAGSPVCPSATFKWNRFKVIQLVGFQKPKKNYPKVFLVRFQRPNNSKSSSKWLGHTASKLISRHTSISDVAHDNGCSFPAVSAFP